MNRKYTNITIHPHIYINSGFHYYPTIEYKTNDGRGKSGDLYEVGAKPKYFFQEYKLQLYRALISPDTKFYEYDRDGNKRYANYRYHGAAGFYYFVRGAAMDIKEPIQVWASFSDLKACYRLKSFWGIADSEFPEVYTDIEISDWFTCVNSRGDRVRLNPSAMAPWRPEFTVELKDNINSFLRYFKTNRAKILQQENPMYNSGGLEAIEHIQTTLKQLGETFLEVEADSK